MQGLTDRGRWAGLVAAKSIILAVIAGFLWTAPGAQAKYADIIIDADSGEVMHEFDADASNYPASLTKMMTLYLTFESLRDGALKLDQQLTVSAHAASRAPSKLGLMPGESIAVRDAILALVTKSANDAASVVAEAQAGSEDAFAERMTRKARRLGMKSTVFYNASGLPSRNENRTTARDLATLARALYRDFPADYHYFATREFAWHGAVFANHNHLMNSFQGMDGIKTGFINASGFNLAASAMRDHRRLIGIVMGGQSARARDVRMAQLLNSAFAQRGSRVIEARAETPAADDTAETEEPAETAVVSAPVQPRRSQTAALAPRRPAGSDHWSVQLGAFSQRSAAQHAVQLARTKVAALHGKKLEVLSPERSEKEHLFRVRIQDLSKREADHVCSALHHKHQKCALVAPATTKLASN